MNTEDIVEQVKDANESIPVLLKAMLPSGVILNAVSHWFSYNSITSATAWFVSIVLSVITTLYIYEKYKEKKLHNKAIRDANDFQKFKDDIEKDKIIQELEDNGDNPK